MHVITKLGGLVGLGLVVALAAGCASTPIKGKPMGTGSVYSDVRVNDKTDANAAMGSKMGESCATAILGVISTGDASVATAARMAGITKVAVVDAYHSNILGVISKYCTRVLGE